MGRVRFAGTVTRQDTGEISALSPNHQQGRERVINQTKSLIPIISALQTVLAARMLVKHQANALGVTR